MRNHRVYSSVTGQDVNLAQSKVNKKYGVLGLGRISHGLGPLHSQIRGLPNSVTLQEVLLSERLPGR